MAFPQELRSYANEDDFIQRLLIPLLNRLGFSVVNYHGKSEYGRDLILAEVDRFGHVRFHGLQAKYVSSIGLEAVREVIDDCQQAFTVSFRHPQTGIKEYISTFYAVNGGEFSDQARERYFEALKPRWGDNAKLIDGKALLVLDRWATINRQQLIGETFFGLHAELEENRSTMREFLPVCRQCIANIRTPLPGIRFRDVAISNYLTRPFACDRLPYETMRLYSQQTRLLNRLLDSCCGIIAAGHVQGVARAIMDVAPEREAWSAAIDEAICRTLAELGPVTWNVSGTTEIG